MIALTVGASILALIGLASLPTGRRCFGEWAASPRLAHSRGENVALRPKEGALEFHAGLMATIQKEGGAEELLGLINKAGDGDGEGQDGANWWKEQP